LVNFILRYFILNVAQFLLLTNGVRTNGYPLRKGHAMASVSYHVKLLEVDHGLNIIAKTVTVLKSKDRIKSCKTGTEKDF
jgi:hypothetical protein